MLTTGDIVSIVFFLSTLLILATGVPIAFSLAGLSLLFALVGNLLGAFDFSTLINAPLRIVATMGNETLVAVPLFILMGNVLERSGIAADLLNTMGRLFGRRPGGLGFSVVIVGAVLAAATGVVGATVATMALISLPAMMRAGYDNKLASGVVCASSTLAQIIPPSTILIFMADVLAAVNQGAQMKMGNFAPVALSSGDLFAGALLPGLLLVGLFLLYLLSRAVLDPKSCPPLVEAEGDRVTAGELFSALLPPLLLILAVLGSILGGVATATESASIGVLGAVVLAAARGRLDRALLAGAGRATVVTTSMIFAIVLAASLFSLVFRGLGGEHMVAELLSDMPGGLHGAMAIVMLTIFVLGFFLDTFEIILIMVPICGAPLIMLGADPIWLGVMIALNLQTSFLTPPFGFTLFYLRGLAPPQVRTSEIWLGALPWVGLQLLALTVVWGFPGLVTWLPNAIFR